MNRYYEQMQLYHDQDLPHYQELRHATHTARKQHKCDTCDEPIAIGESYQLYVYINDDTNFETAKYHATKCYLR